MKFKTLNSEELSIVTGGSKGRRRRKIADCAKAIDWGALKDGVKGGLAGTAFGTPVGTVGGSCLSGFIDALPSGSGMIKGCVEGAVKDFAKQNRHKKHKHR